MSLLVLLLQAAVLYIATRVLWHLLSRLVLVAHPLDKIPGPPSQSFVTGKEVCPKKSLLIYRRLISVQGNLGQLFARNGWGFQRELQNYNTVVKLHGPFGVSPSCLSAIHTGYNVVLVI